MSQTETKMAPTKTQQQSSPSLNLAELKSVKWVQDISMVKSGVDFTSDKYRATKRRMPVFMWIFASIEMVVISIFLFIHSLPWPNWMLEILFKIDQMIVDVLEFVSQKVEWWWDNISVRLMRLWERLEALVDAILSLCLFVVYKFFEVCIWTASVVVGVLSFIFAPIIWVIKAVLPPPEKKRTPPSTPTVMITDASNNVYTSTGHKLTSSDQERDDLTHQSGSTSECESDVSVVSETWSIGHTDKLGKSYNKVEMKVTAEGRLRAAMYKRVKAQLGLMRKNSISYSRGMTSYARQLLVPKVIPALQSLKNWLYSVAAKYGLVEFFLALEQWVNKHYFVSLVVSFCLSILAVPLNIANKVLSVQKKRSRRTRSMRSESLRRRTGCGSPVVPPTILEPFGLSKSEEPVLIEEPEYTNLRRLQKTPLKVEDDPMRDSALASSIDDLSHTSDSNDGSYSLKDQVIHEEEHPTQRLGHEETEPTAAEETKSATEEVPSVKSDDESIPAKPTASEFTPDSPEKTDESLEIPTRPFKKETRSSLKNRSDKQRNGTGTKSEGHSDFQKKGNSLENLSKDDNSSTVNGTHDEVDNRKRKISFNIAS